jgi:hypothetical protein
MERRDGYGGNREVNVMGVIAVLEVTPVCVRGPETSRRRRSGFTTMETWVEYVRDDVSNARIV